MKKDRSDALNHALIMLIFSTIGAGFLYWINQPLTTSTHSIPTFGIDGSFHYYAMIPPLSSFLLPIFLTFNTFGSIYQKAVWEQADKLENTPIFGIVGIIVGAIIGATLSLIPLLITDSFDAAVIALALGLIVGIISLVADGEVTPNLMAFGNGLSITTGGVAMFCLVLFKYGAGIGEAAFCFVITVAILRLATRIVMAPAPLLIAVIERLIAIGKTPEAKGEERTANT